MVITPSFPQNEIVSGYSVPHCGQRRLTGAMLADAPRDREYDAYPHPEGPLRVSAAIPDAVAGAVRERQLLAVLGADEEEISAGSTLPFAEATEDRGDL